MHEKKNNVAFNRHLRKRFVQIFSVETVQSLIDWFNAKHGEGVERLLEKDDVLHFFGRPIPLLNKS